MRPARPTLKRSPTASARSASYAVRAFVLCTLCCACCAVRAVLCVLCCACCACVRAVLCVLCVLCILCVLCVLCVVYVRAVRATLCYIGLGSERFHAPEICNTIFVISTTVLLATFSAKLFTECCRATGLLTFLPRWPQIHLKSIGTSENQ